jgi:prevent-host-death family protein
MSIAEFMPLAEVKAHLSEVVDEVAREGAKTTITRHGKPAAVIVGVAEYDSLIETLEVLSDQSLVEELLAARLEKAIPMTKAEMFDFINTSRA